VEQPEEFQIRNSNAMSLAVQVTRAGGLAQILPIARDNYESTRGLIERGLAADLLLLSGGVSAGKYDIVERVLADLGAEFFFDRVLIQPGQPLVFGSVGSKFFFGLPGESRVDHGDVRGFRSRGDRDPGRLRGHVAAAVTRAADARFSAQAGLDSAFCRHDCRTDGSTIEPESWQGSGDVGALARANAFLVADPDRESYAAGDDIRVLMK
jgi:molybdopterin molybdotransferase